MFSRADVDDETNQAERDDSRGPTMTQKGKWNSSDWHDSHCHSNVLEYLEGEH